MNCDNDEHFGFNVWYSGVVLCYTDCFFSELWSLQIEILIMWKVEHYWINSLQKFLFSRRMIDIFLDFYWSF